MKTRELTPASLDEHAVWTWDDDEYHLIPVTDPDDAWRETLFIQSRMKCWNGVVLDGYIIASGLSVYAIGVFLDGDNLTFNCTVPDLTAADEARLAETIGIKGLSPFPIEYRAGVIIRGDRLSGEFWIE
jgi:hypothetical protein